MYGAMLQCRSASTTPSCLPPGLRSCATPHRRLSRFRLVLRLPFDSGPLDQSRDRRDVPIAVMRGQRRNAHQRCCSSRSSADVTHRGDSVADGPRWDLRLRRVSTVLAIGLGRHARAGFQQRLEIAEDPRPAAAALGRIATARHHAGDHRGVRDIMSDGDRTHALPLHDFVSEA